MEAGLMKKLDNLFIKWKNKQDSLKHKLENSKSITYQMIFGESGIDVDNLFGMVDQVTAIRMGWADKLYCFEQEEDQAIWEWRQDK